MVAPFDKSDYMPVLVTGFEALTVDGSATAFTPATADRAISAHVSVEGAQVRYRVGNNPTASVGTVLNEGDEIVVWGKADIDAIRFIRTGGVSATLNTHFAR